MNINLCIYLWNMHQSWKLKSDPDVKATLRLQLTLALDFSVDTLMNAAMHKTELAQLKASAFTTCMNCLRPNSHKITPFAFFNCILFIFYLFKTLAVVPNIKSNSIAIINHKSASRSFTIYDTLYPQTLKIPLL